MAVVKAAVRWTSEKTDINVLLCFAASNSSLMSSW